MGKIKCFICKKRCEGSVLKIKENKYIHRKCFLCFTCKVTLETGGYFKKEDKFYCRHHYLENYGVKCCKCLKTAEGEVMVFLGDAFHFDCFKCSFCEIVLRRGEKVAKVNNEFICPTCFVKQAKADNKKKEDAADDERHKKETQDAENANHNNESQKLTISGSQEDIVKTESVMDPAMCTSIISAIINDDGATTTPERAWPNNNGIRKFVGRGGQFDTQSDTEELRSESLIPSSCSPINNQTISINKCTSLTSLKSPKSPTSPNLYPTMSYLQLKDREHELIDPRAQFNANRAKFPSTDPRPVHFHVPATPFFFTRSNPNISTKSSLSSKIPSPQLVTPSTDVVIRKEAVRKFFSNNVQIKSHTIQRPHSEVKMNMMQMQNNHISIKNTNPLDPILASRSPGANYEPDVEPRYSRHTDASPSRLTFLRNSQGKQSNEADSETPTNFLTQPLIPGHSSSMASPNNQERRTLVTTRSSSTIDYATLSKLMASNNKIKYYQPKDFLNPTPRSTSVDSLVNKIIPYNELALPNIKIRRDIDQYKLESYLSDIEFVKVFHMLRDSFYHLPEWKRNDLKRRVGLF